MRRHSLVSFFAGLCAVHGGELHRDARGSRGRLKGPKARPCRPFAFCPEEQVLAMVVNCEKPQLEEEKQAVLVLAAACNILSCDPGILT